MNVWKRLSENRGCSYLEWCKGGSVGCGDYEFKMDAAMGWRKLSVHLREQGKVRHKTH